MMATNEKAAHDFKRTNVRDLLNIRDILQSRLSGVCHGSVSHHGLITRKYNDLN